MSENSRQALVGAIGGTYISLAIMDIDAYAIANFALLSSADFETPMEAIARYLKSLPRVPDKVGLSIAGLVNGDSAKMSHLPWSFDCNDVRAVTNASHICFVNEFEALALAIPTLSSYDVLPVTRGAIKRTANRAVISAGTGLGAAGLVWTGARWQAPSVAGRFASFPAPQGHEFDIRAVVAHEGFVEAGQILTGHGMVTLYQAMLKAEKREPASLTAPQISKAGLSGDDPIAVRTLERMATWLGRFTGDIALHYGATGGVYLAGGMPANIAPALQTRHFIEAFEGIGDRREYLADTPVQVIKAGADAGLRGAAVALANSLPVRPGNVHRMRA
jgi:glucokinase